MLSGTLKYLSAQVLQPHAIPSSIKQYQALAPLCVLSCASQSSLVSVRPLEAQVALPAPHICRRSALQ